DEPGLLALGQLVGRPQALELLPEFPDRTGLCCQVRSALVPWRDGRSAGGGAVHDPGGSEASSPGAVGLSTGHAAAVERGGNGPGVVAAGPLGGEPSRARAGAPAGGDAAEGGAAQNSAAGAPGGGRADEVRATAAAVEARAWIGSSRRTHGGCGLGQVAT